MQWGNDYMHARYYSSNLGRFLSVDPVGGKVGSSQSWNRYAYVQNNPLKYTDPDGEWAHIAIGAVVGAALNAGAKAIQNSAEGRPVTEGLGKAALVGAAGGAVTAATFGMGAALLTGGGAAGAIATLSSTASIPTLTATGGLIVGGTSAGLGGAVTGAGNEAVVQGNTNFQDVASAAATSGLKSVPLGALLGAAGAGPVTEAVAGEVSTVADAAYQYVAKELADSLAPEEETE
jgi:RHS repeat-associated protein